MKYIRIIVSAASIPIYFYIFLYLLYDWVVAAFIFGAFFIGSRLMDVLEQIIFIFFERRSWLSHLRAFRGGSLD